MFEIEIWVTEVKGEGGDIKEGQKGKGFISYRNKLFRIFGDEIKLFLHTHLDLSMENRKLPTYPPTNQPENAKSNQERVEK